jgi:FdhD protein
VNPPRAVTSIRAVKVRPGRRIELPEEVATEAPMQILVAGPGETPSPLAVTMRTPGHDFELAAGFAVTEGVARRGEITSVTYCEDPWRASRQTSSAPDPWHVDAHPQDSYLETGKDARYNHVTLRLGSPYRALREPRRFPVAASCGVCGKASIDEVEVMCSPIGPTAPIQPEVISRLPDELRKAQRGFDRTGGLHAAGLFDPSGLAWCIREDVGRHNAVDKVIGWTALTPEARIEDLSGWILLVSGRVSFEIVQKSAVAGIGTIAAISAPSSLAVDAADRLGVTLLGFVRGDGFNVYSHHHRIGAGA